MSSIQILPISSKFEDNTTGVTTMTVKGSVLVDMDASDTAIVQFFQNGGSQQTDVDTDGYFSGFLAC